MIYLTFYFIGNTYQTDQQDISSEKMQVISRQKVSEENIQPTRSSLANQTPLNFEFMQQTSSSHEDIDLQESKTEIIDTGKKIYV